MQLPRVGDEYPAAGVHARHHAIITAIDTHGVATWDDQPGVPPTLMIVCSCGDKWLEPLPEAVASAVGCDIVY